MMDKKKIFYVLFTLIIISQLLQPLLLNGQSEDIKIEGAKKSWYPLFYSFFHNTDIRQGVSVTCSWPAFYSPIGEMLFSYRNSHSDAYSLGVGGFYVLVGLNKKIGDYNEWKLFSNLSLGYSIQEDFLGNIGISIYRKLDSKQNIEISLDGFIHNGVDGDEFVPKVPYTQGIAFTGSYSCNIYKSFYFSLNFGCSLVRYTYVRYAYASRNWPYRYISYRTYKNIDSIEKYSNPGWDSHFQFPLGIAFIYIF